jgi:hypothetical protein
MNLQNNLVPNRLENSEQVPPKVENRKVLLLLTFGDTFTSNTTLVLKCGKDSQI